MSDTKIWFKAKQYGWGWYPATWQGWLTTLIFIIVIILHSIFSTSIGGDSPTTLFLVWFLVRTALIVGVLLYICYTHGEKPEWRWGQIEEQVLVLDENGNKTNMVVSKSVAHAKALWHQTVHIWILNKKGEVLLQKRALSKLHYPGVWGSTGGHVSYGETAEQSIVREMYEELGIRVDASELTSLGRISMSTSFQNGACTENEHIDMFVITLHDSEVTFKFIDREVSAVHWYSISDLLERRSIDSSPVIFKDVEVATLTKYLSSEKYGAH